MKRKITITIFLFLLSIFLWFIEQPKVPFIDNKANEYFNSSIEKSVTAFATAGLINSTVSVIKESELQLEPAGVGVSVALGQVLDPIDDLTERVSDLLITIIAAFGIQKIIFDLSNIILPKLLSLLSLFTIFIIWLNSKNRDKYLKVSLKLTMVFITLRLFMPIASLCNNGINEIYFNKMLSEEKSKLEYYKAELNTFNSVEYKTSDGWWDAVSNNAESLVDATSKIKSTFIFIKDNFNELITIITNLILIHAAVFIVQIILLPLLLIFVFIKFINKLFNTKILIPKKLLRI